MMFHLEGGVSSVCTTWNCSVRKICPLPPICLFDYVYQCELMYIFFLMFILLFRLFQLGSWELCQVGSCVSLTCPSLLIFEHFHNFWQESRKVASGSSSIFLASALRSASSPRSPGLKWRMVSIGTQKPRSGYQMCLLLLGYHCSQTLPANRTKKYVCKYVHFQNYLCKLNMSSY